jgi:hypothetical protein
VQTLVMSVPFAANRLIRARKRSSASWTLESPPGSTNTSRCPASRYETSGTICNPCAHRTSVVVSPTVLTVTPSPLMNAHEVSTSYGPAKSSSSTPSKTATPTFVPLTLLLSAGLALEQPARTSTPAASRKRRRLTGASSTLAKRASGRCCLRDHFR